MRTPETALAEIQELMQVTRTEASGLILTGELLRETPQLPDAPLTQWAELDLRRAAFNLGRQSERFLDGRVRAATYYQAIDDVRDRLVQLRRLQQVSGEGQL